MADRIRYEKCPLCGSAALADEKTADCSQHPLYDSALSPLMHWKRCGDCGHVFTDGYFTEEACRIVFGKTNEGQKVGGPVEKNRVISARMIEKVLPYVQEGIWLDVGFGNGSLLFTAQEYGFTPVGLDMRRENVEILKSLGIEAHCEDVCKLALPEPCAVVSMADVLEHMPYPREALDAAKRLLAPGGVLFLSMPNRESIVWKVLDGQNANPYWGELEHYHNFGRGRLYALLADSGFTPVRYGISERYRVCMEVVAVRD